MINVNELMVGNWICFDEDRTLQVTVQDLIEVRRNPSMYSGIKLSEALLDRAGFTYEASSYEKYGIRIWYENFKGFYHLNNSFTVYFEYVHQLQNFYFPILKHELEFCQW